jgi:HEAT repeat protein
MKILPSRKEFGYGHLKEMQKEGDVAGLISALDSPKVQKSKHLRAAVVTNLRKTGARDAVPILCKLLQSDPSETVRRMAALSLGELGDAGALPALRAALDDESDRVQLWAIRSLGQLRDRESVERLTIMCDDPDGGHRQFAALALSEIGDQRAVPALTPLLDDPDLMVRREARQALTRLGAGDG